MTQTPLCLVADIGGTNTRVALADGACIRTDSVRRFRNTEFPDLDTILARYLGDGGVARVDGACVAAAGPVKDGVATMTNLDWTIDGGTLTRATGAGTVSILNDLQAPGYALGHIAPENLRPLITAPQVPGGTMLVINVGTGFNAAAVHDTSWGRMVTASECGHVNMPVRTEADLRLAHFVETAHGFPGVEDVMSGRGLERLHRHLHGIDTGSVAVLQAWQAGDAAAAQTVMLWRDLLAGPLAMVLNVVGSSIVPVGGGLANVPALITLLDGAVRANLLRSTDRPLLVPAALTVEPGLVGAALAGLAGLSHG